MIRPFGAVRPEVHPETFIADGVQVWGWVQLAEGVSLWPGASLRGDLAPIRVGRFSNLQEGALVHVDPDLPVEIGQYVTVGHGAIVHSAKVGDGTLIGMGAILLNGAVVGEGSILGAGSLVGEGKEIPPGVLAFGQPARVKRDLTLAEIADLRRWAEEYWRLARIYRDGSAD